MKRRTSTAPMRIYTYGCRLPTQGAELVERQLVMAHHYYNKLIEIERRRRGKVRAVQSASSELVAQWERAVAIYEDNIKEVRNAIAVKKAAGRTSKVKLTEERSVLAVIRDLKRQAIDSLRAVKLAARTPELLAEFARIATQANVEIKTAREEAARNGLYWGTYSLVEKAVQAANKSPTDPEFRRFTVVPNRQGQPTIARGRVGVQLQKQAHWMSTMLNDRGSMAPDVAAFVDARFARKLSTEAAAAEMGITADVAKELLARATAPFNGVPVSAIVGGNDERLQIDAPAKNRMSKVRIRVGTAADGHSPVFAEFPFRMHRDLPADGVIKQAWILKSKKGRWVDWSLQISVEAASLYRDTRQPSDGGVVAIDIGWRLRETGAADSLRVAYWLDDKGQHGELVLPHDDRTPVRLKGRKKGCKRRPESFRARLDHACSLRAIQDRNFQEVRTKLTAWKEIHSLPPDLATALEWLHAWKAPRKLGAVIEQWRTRRFDGDAEMFAKLEAWWKQHRHLYDWESCERDRALNARKNLYRKWAADFTRQYAVVVIEDAFLAQVALLQPVDSTKANMPRPTRRNRTVAACSEFVAALKSAAPGNGCTIDEEPCENTTATCPDCQHIEKFDHRSLMHACERCGDAQQPVDQDLRAARNLLAAYAGKPSCSQSEAQVSEIAKVDSPAVTTPAQEGMP